MFPRIVVLLLAASFVSGLAGYSAAGQDEAGTKKVVTVPIANDTGENIFFFVNGKYGTTGRIPLSKDGPASVVAVDFYEDGNERALDAFNEIGSKVLSQFKFIPGEFCLLITKNQTVEKKAPVGSKQGKKYGKRPY